MTTSTQLKLTSHYVSKVTEHTFVIETDNGTVYYKEWWNDKGIVIDSAMRDADGNEIIDCSLYDDVQNLIFGEL